MRKVLVLIAASTVLVAGAASAQEQQDGPDQMARILAHLQVESLPERINRGYEDVTSLCEMWRLTADQRSAWQRTTLVHGMFETMQSPYNHTVLSRFIELRSEEREVDSICAVVLTDETAPAS